MVYPKLATAACATEGGFPPSSALQCAAGSAPSAPPKPSGLGDNHPNHPYSNLRKAQLRFPVPCAGNYRTAFFCRYSNGPADFQETPAPAAHQNQSKDGVYPASGRTPPPLQHHAEAQRPSAPSPQAPYRPTSNVPPAAKTLNQRRR